MDENDKSWQRCSEVSASSIFDPDPFIGCDGKPHSDEFLKYILEIAVGYEEYERAAIIQDEITRRTTLKLKTI